jgi:CarD family transcriptional regulator
MFNIGDLIIYSAHGICHIDDICEKTYSGITKSYYILHPVQDNKLTINIPVDNDKVTMLKLIDRDEAEEIIESFKLPGIDWIELSNQRTEIYAGIVKSGNRTEICKLLNTLMRKNYEAEINGKKLYEKDIRILTLIQNTLFAELAMSLDTTYEEIYEKIISLIAVSEKVSALGKNTMGGVDNNEYRQR